MTFIKKLLKKFELPLQQLSRPYKEREQLLVTNYNKNISIPHCKEHTNGPISRDLFGLKIKQYNRFFNDRFQFILGNKLRNCFCELYNGKIINIKNIIVHNNVTYFVGTELQLVDMNLYTLPCKSKDIGICINSSLNDFSEPISFKILDIRCKLWLMPCKNFFAFFPIIHTIQL